MLIAIDNNRSIVGVKEYIGVFILFIFLHFFTLKLFPQKRLKIKNTYNQINDCFLNTHFFHFLSFPLSPVSFPSLLSAALSEVQGWREGHLLGADGHHEAPQHAVLQLQGDSRGVADLLWGGVRWRLLQQRHIPWGHRGEWGPGMPAPRFAFCITKPAKLLRSLSSGTSCNTRFRYYHFPPQSIVF